MSQVHYNTKECVCKVVLWLCGVWAADDRPYAGCRIVAMKPRFSIKKRAAKRRVKNKRSLAATQNF